MLHNRGNSGNKDKQKQTSEVLNESRETLYGTDRPNDYTTSNKGFQVSGLAFKTSKLQV
jgi:hypothetical protein